MKLLRPLAALFLGLGTQLLSQTTFYYRSNDATGRLVRTGVTNVSLASMTSRFAPQVRRRVGTPEIKRDVIQPQPRTAKTLAGPSARAKAMAAAAGLAISPTSTAFGFGGLSHYDQRNANLGNQFSVEPPNPEIAVANGWVLEGVNNAIQVYSTTGTPLLPRVLSTNELFQVAAAIDRNTGVNGVFPTDMRVFYDHGIDRWLVLQRAQDYDEAGWSRDSSHLYLAVSQTGDPTGSYNIYTMDTTNPSRPGCPCFSDFPQIGADQYGIYISSDEYDTRFGLFADVSILAISKASLASSSTVPRVHEFVIPRMTGYEATIRPAITPPGASYALVRGGVEFFLSTQSLRYSDSSFAVWALTNTASLNTTPDLLLIQSVIPGMPYTYPDVAAQRTGPLPYGWTLSPPGLLAYIHGGRDCRVLSLAYSAGRLFATLATDAVDDVGRHVVAGAYAVLFPSLRGDVLSAPVWRYGYLLADNVHVLRPAVAVNARGAGAISFTLVGRDHFPSAAFVPVEGFVPGGVIQVTGPGVAPEDGFSGYPDSGISTTGVARWGDYSSAVVAPNGSVWMTVEYIPGGMRTELANWGTRVYRYGP